MSSQKLATSNELGTLICQTLGLDASEVTAMTVRIEAGEPALIEVTRSLYLDEAKEIAGQLTRYELIPAQD
ncbi:hypothetical protein GEV39_21975 [Pseudomonas sp. NY5710]|uniref:hypothetical protein n=1 Tax=Pseudomonas sp. NY5710 TaxID=2662033 RepID=UPI00157131AD|nr:hypothetical protein [Pseudomonas sp. NY5710]QKL03867.1 hypothetical protein GEV39_21975 [Pseudomonas sp. NY5710]